MKDIMQYFATHTKMVDEEVVAASNVAGQEQDEPEETVAKGKRKRVKIRISRTRDSKERMCDIIESKNDLIDKTPSPFNAKVNNDKKTLQDETPKSRSADLNSKQSLKKDKFAVEINGSQLTQVKDVLQDEKMSSMIIVDLDDDSDDDTKNVSEESGSIELVDASGSQREESNAFQVLMNRSKPIQYKSPLPQPVEEEELKEKLNELKSKRKEKLIALADKKGYSKRKLVELEESERIEKTIEDRMRFFKGNNNGDVTLKKDDNIELLSKNKQHSGNLLDYFSKSPLESANNDIKCTSTFIVKADVHRTDNSDTAPVLKPVLNKSFSNKRWSKSELDLSAVDDIQIIASENLFSPQTVERGKQKREKPRWALRIKLQSSENNDCANSDSTDDDLFSPRSKVKLNVSSTSRNFVNMEEDKGICATKSRNNKKNESVNKKRNISDTAKDTIISNGNEDVNTYLRESNNTNGTKQERSNVTSKTVITITDDKYEIMNDSLLKRKPTEKLAPLFVKRRKTNSVATIARRLFLQSDLIDVENKSTNHKPNNDTFMFPLISHVTQLKEKLDSPAATIKHNFPMKVEKKYSPSLDVSNYKYIINYSEAPRATETVNELVKENIDKALSEIKKVYPDAQRMWKMIKAIKDQLEKKSQTKGRKGKSLERKRMLMASAKNEQNESHDCAWTCKYKPISAQDIVGNEEAAGKLKNWLTGWRTSLTKKDDSSSGDEFYLSDCSSSYNNENNQVAVLLGPHGSGKSASVYAVAEELDYSVLEVNASSRRTGKRILKELEEATKSHRIKKNKHNSLFEQATNKNEESKVTQNSLILLEDIDLIFEEDEGFISAAYQLASNTKRPIVMTCRDTCPHLSKMAPQQNKIYFQKVNGNRVTVLLELISLAETGYRIPHDYLMKLLQAGDLRQALLQLQYLLMSSPSVLFEQSTTVKSSLWQDMQLYIYKPAIKLNRKQKTKNTKHANTKMSNNVARMMSSLADDLDGISLVSSLINIEDIVLNMSKENLQPNLSLAENLSFYSVSHDLNANIASFIRDQILHKNVRMNEHVENLNIVLRKQLNQGVDLALSHVTSVCLDQRIMAVDYLPTARAICRAEESRSTANYKRGNRFYHYLHSLQVPTASMKPNILAAACKSLQERGYKIAST